MGPAAGACVRLHRGREQLQRSKCPRKRIGVCGSLGAVGRGLCWAAALMMKGKGLPEPPRKEQSGAASLGRCSPTSPLEEQSRYRRLNDLLLSAY